jgi:hypothetical protein
MRKPCRAVFVCFCFFKRWGFFKNNFVWVSIVSSFEFFGLCGGLRELQMCLPLFLLLHLDLSINIK